MENLDDLKKCLNKEQLEKYVYWCFLETQLGKTIFCSVDYFDDLYVCLVGGVLCNFGRGRTPEYMEGIDPSEKDRDTLKSFEKMRSHLSIECGRYVYDFDKWLSDNPESEEWLNIIKESIELTKIFQNNPMKWCTDLRKIMIDNKFIRFGFIDGSEFIMNKKTDKDREVIIQAFLSGKKFSDGEQFAPNVSLDIANKWYDENFK